MTKFKWTLNMIIAAPMILICSIILAGGGHGFPDQLIVLFPWTFISNIINSQFFFCFLALYNIQFMVFCTIFQIKK
jgi:hypothetical protein